MLSGCSRTLFPDEGISSISHFICQDIPISSSPPEARIRLLFEIAFSFDGSIIEMSWGGLPPSGKTDLSGTAVSF